MPPGHRRTRGHIPSAARPSTSTSIAEMNESTARISMHEAEYSLRCLDHVDDRRRVFSIVLVGNQIAEYLRLSSVGCQYRQ
jgi:hypothetical protein